VLLVAWSGGDQDYPRRGLNLPDTILLDATAVASAALLCVI
jgi:hypothetical protein